MGALTRIHELFLSKSEEISIKEEEDRFCAKGDKRAIQDRITQLEDARTAADELYGEEFSPKARSRAERTYWVLDYRICILREYLSKHY